MSERWLDVPVPEHLLADVIRFVSDRLDDDGVDASDTDVPGTDEDGWAWWQDLEVREQKLLAALVARGGDEVDSWVAADDLEVTTRELGGIIGPLNKRMRQDKLRPPVRSRQASVAGRRVKRLSVDPAYASFVGVVPEPPKKVKPVVRRSGTRRG